MEQIWFQPESRFTGAGATDDQHIFVAGILRVCWAVAHHQPFRLCQQYVVCKYRVNVGLYILGIAP